MMTLYLSAVDQKASLQHWIASALPQQAAAHPLTQAL
jgi:hypothetical protein